MISPTDISRAQVFGQQALKAAAAELAAAAPEVAPRTAAERWDDALALRWEFARNHHRTVKGAALDLSPRWLRAIYREKAKSTVLMKSVQCGVSEWIVCSEFAMATVGLTTFHVLPTFDVRNRFVAQRVDRLVLQVPRYQELLLTAIGETNNLRLKNFGPGQLYYVGSNTPNEFIEIPADAKIVDEVDRCDQQNLAMADDRLEGSDLKASIIVGQPSHADYGVAELYERSDQCEWQIHCRACGEWQPLDFFVNVVRVIRDAEGNEQDYELLDAEWTEESERDVRVFCRECAAALDRHENERGHCRWQPTHPGRKIRGYHISKLFTQQTTVATLWEKFQDALNDAWKRALFMNSDLGLPYSPPGSTLTDELLAACARDYIMPQSVGAHPCSMGVDVGAKLDVRISDSPERAVRRAAFMGRVKSFDDLTDLMRRYHVRRCVIDAEPEVRKTIEWADSFGTGRKRRVWRADLIDQTSARDLPKPTDEDDGLLRLDRTQLLDLATSDVLSQRNWLPRNYATLLRGKWLKMMKANKRILATAPDGTQRWTWTKGEDHARFADAFDCYAARGLGITMASGDAWSGVEGISIEPPYGNY